MPPGPNKRKDSNKKKIKKKKNTDAAKTNKKSLSSIKPLPHHGESDGGQVSNAEKEEDNIISGQDYAREQQGKIEIDSGSSSHVPHEKKLNSRSSSSDNKSCVKKNAALSETVADLLCKPVESSSENGTHKVEDLGSKTPSIVEPVKTVNQTDLVVPETPLEQTVFNDNVLKSNPLSKENEVQKFASDQTDSPQSKNSLIPDSTNVKCPYCGKSSDDRVETPGCSERQPLLASTPPQVSEKSSWKSCCGIFELFSNSRK